MRTHKILDRRVYAPGADEAPDFVKPDGTKGDPDFDKNINRLYKEMYQRNVPLAREQRKVFVYDPQIKYTMSFSAGWVLTAPEKRERAEKYGWPAQHDITELLIFDVNDRGNAMECIAQNGSLVTLTYNPQGTPMKEKVRPKKPKRRKRRR